MSLHKEVHLEAEICDALTVRGWFYETGVSAQYDRVRALFPEDTIAWVQETNPKAWAALEKGFSGKAAEVLLDRLRNQLDTRGTLDVLRNGIDIHPVRGTLPLAQFKPASGMNPELTARFNANRLRVVRQVRYSVAHENCIDLVLFLNGIPVASAELKSDFTQSVEDAVDQYRFDRDPTPKGAKAEALLSFPGGRWCISRSQTPKYG
jgi:type I restriction enzyme, R subunit